MNDDSDIGLVLKLAAVFFGWSVACGVAGWQLNNALSETIPLTLEQKRNIAIDFMADHGSWKYVLCTIPMDGGKK